MANFTIVSHLSSSASPTCLNTLQANGPAPSASTFSPSSRACYFQGAPRVFHIIVQPAKDLLSYPTTNARNHLKRSSITQTRLRHPQGQPHGPGPPRHDRAVPAPDDDRGVLLLWVFVCALDVRINFRKCYALLLTCRANRLSRNEPWPYSAT